MAISKTQKKIYDFLRQKAIEGVPPSVREICAAVGLSSTSSVQAGLDALEREGYITRDPMHKRSIRINGIAENVNHVPLLGTVTAGQPVLAFEDIMEYIPYNGPASTSADLFALKVKGESMLNAGIFDGDIAVVERTPYANNGDIVVAMIQGDFESESTVKAFYKENGHIRLQPRNSSMEPIIVDDCEIVGLVKGVFRYLS